MFPNSEIVIDTIIDVMTSRLVTNTMIAMGIIVTLITTVNIARVSMSII